MSVQVEPVQVEPNLLHAVIISPTFRPRQFLAMMEMYAHNDDVREQAVLHAKRAKSNGDESDLDSCQKLGGGLLSKLAAGNSVAEQRNNLAQSGELLANALKERQKRRLFMDSTTQETRMSFAEAFKTVANLVRDCQKKRQRDVACNPGNTGVIHTDAESIKNHLKLTLLPIQQAACRSYDCPTWLNAWVMKYTMLAADNPVAGITHDPPTKSTLPSEIHVSQKQKVTLEYWTFNASATDDAQKVLVNHTNPIQVNVGVGKDQDMQNKFLIIRPRPKAQGDHDHHIYQAVAIAPNRKGSPSEGLWSVVQSEGELASVVRCALRGESGADAEQRKAFRSRRKRAYRTLRKMLSCGVLTIPSKRKGQGKCSVPTDRDIEVQQQRTKEALEEALYKANVAVREIQRKAVESVLPPVPSYDATEEIAYERRTEEKPSRRRRRQKRAERFFGNGETGEGSNAAFSGATHASAHASAGALGVDLSKLDASGFHDLMDYVDSR